MEIRGAVDMSIWGTDYLSIWGTVNLLIWGTGELGNCLYVYMGNWGNVPHLTFYFLLSPFDISSNRQFPIQHFDIPLIDKSSNRQFDIPHSTLNFLLYTLYFLLSSFDLHRKSLLL
jgi:hypothetical protein